MNLSSPQTSNLDFFDATNAAAADLYDIVSIMLTQCLDDPCNTQHMFVLHEV